MDTPRHMLREAWETGPGVVGWLSAVNHKAIGVRFIVTAFAFLLAGGVLALLIRAQLLVPDNRLLDPETFNEVFTMHGTTMMFLFAIPVLEGVAMYFMPLLLGSRDLPFPRLNAFGYWAYLFGGVFVYVGFLTGDAPGAGWFASAPLSGPVYAPGSGMDYWLLGVTFVEVAGVVGAIELIVAFLRRRAPGMVLRRIPVFAWAVFVTAWMMLLAFPSIIAGSTLLELDRAFGTRFFDAVGGGDPVLWQHLFWYFGHPEVYIILLPALGIVSMVVPVFSRRPLAGYGLVVAALVAIGIVSFGLWVHHMFTMGLPVMALSVFAAASFLIAVPSGLQVFAWLTTMFRGRPRFGTPMLFIVGFVVTFVLGGVTGVMVAAVPFDLQVHDSYFVVAHFHYVLIGGMVFPLFAGLYYWFPKVTGRLLGEGLGRASFWCMFGGFHIAFMPQHVLGLQGMPRRVATYSETEGWGVWNLVSSLGAVVLATGVLLTVLNVLRWRRGRPAGDDPWRGESLEWTTTSPPPPWNFREMPVVGDDDDGRRAREEARPLVRMLAEPAGPHREVLDTAPSDGRPLAVVRLPGPSLWPLAAAGAMVLALIGALEKDPVVGAFGAVATVAAFLGWGLTTVRERRDGTPSGDVPVRTSGAGLMGLALGGVAMVKILAALIFAYVLLARGQAWPPEGVDAPDLGLPLAVTAATGCAAGVGWWSLRGVRSGDVRRLLVALPVAALLLAAAGALLVAALDGVGASPTQSAYGSVVWVLGGAVLMLAAAAVVVLLAVLGQAAAGLFDADNHVSVAVAVMLTVFVAVAWLAVLVTVFVSPHLL